MIYAVIANVAYMKSKKQWQRSVAVMGFFLLSISQLCPCVRVSQHAYLHSQARLSCRALAANAQMHLISRVVQVDTCIKIGLSAHKQKPLQVHQAGFMHTYSPDGHVIQSTVTCVQFKNIHNKSTVYHLALSCKCFPQFHPSKQIPVLSAEHEQRNHQTKCHLFCRFSEEKE